jgi:hypothetical protein
VVVVVCWAVTNKSRNDPGDACEYQEEKYQDDQPSKSIAPVRAHAEHPTETATLKQTA